MYFSNVVLRILKLQNCEMVGRDVDLISNLNLRRNACSYHPIYPNERFYKLKPSKTASELDKIRESTH